MSTPSELYRNAIDLNRFSNGVAKRIAVTYNDLVLDAVDQLRGIDELAAPAKAARLRAILAQLKQSLEGWAGTSTLAVVEDLQGLAELQSEFVANELRQALPVNLREQIRSIQISPQFAQSVATIDPTEINVVSLSDDLQAAVTGAPQTFNLTAAQGTTVTLPNGKVLEKSFRGLAESQADLFAKTVRNGLLTGESTDKIARRLKGRLRFGQPGSLRQIAQAGGEVTAVANNQVMALIRTSINQVANETSQQVYKANQDVTKRYRYVATLDSRTSPICRSLDGREFKYGKGPTPPQHFNCRSTTVPIIDYSGLGISRPPQTELRRPNTAFGPSRARRGDTVPSNQTYGEWLDKQPKEVKADVLGASKVPYFNRLAKKFGPTDAIRKFVARDGSELTLQQLQQRYGKPDKITFTKPRPKPKPAVSVKPPKAALKTYTGENFDSVRAQEFRAAQQQGKKLSRYEAAQVKTFASNPKHKKQADDIEAFLNQAPKYEGTVQRGLNMPQKDLEDMLAGYKAGNESLAMESWTSGKATNDFTVGADQHVILRAKNKRGVDIAQYSEYANEQEVLMPTGSRYSLKGVQKEEISPGLTKKGIFRWTVDLEQS